jgi:hypothetical protein
MKKVKTPIRVLAMAWKGGIRGEPTKPAIWDQSKVMGTRDKPVEYPKSWFTTGFCGAIHVAKANVLKN